MMMRLMDFLKNGGITAVFISLTAGGQQLEKTTVGVSSLTDTWILLRDLELNGERNRCIYILKSRGMAHSNQLREFVITGKGIKLIPAYIGQGGVLTGSSRINQEAKDKAEAVQRHQEIARRERDAFAKRLALQGQIASLQAELAAANKEVEDVLRENQRREQQVQRDQADLTRSRRGSQSRGTSTDNSWKKREKALANLTRHWYCDYTSPARRPNPSPRSAI
jgi:circadian clock protein KaiC